MPLGCRHVRRDFSIIAARLRIRAKLHPARNFRNPGAFDYEGYLADNGINVLGSADAKDLVRLPGFSGSRIEFWRTECRRCRVVDVCAANCRRGTSRDSFEEMSMKP